MSGGPVSLPTSPHAGADRFSALSTRPHSLAPCSWPVAKNVLCCRRAKCSRRFGTTVVAVLSSSPRIVRIRSLFVRPTRHVFQRFARNTKYPLLFSFSRFLCYLPPAAACHPCFVYFILLLFRLIALLRENKLDKQRFFFFGTTSKALALKAQFNRQDKKGNLIFILKIQKICVCNLHIHSCLYILLIPNRDF